MRIQWSVGVAEGETERGLLDQYRSGSQPSVAAATPLTDRPAGWPAPSERADEEGDAGRPSWAW